jgi:hypothetical protein
MWAGVVLQVPLDSANPTKKELIFWVAHTENSYDFMSRPRFGIQGKRDLEC